MDQLTAVLHIPGDQVGGGPDTDVHAIRIGTAIVTMHDDLLFLLDLLLEFLPGGRLDTGAGGAVGGR